MSTFALVCGLWFFLPGDKMKKTTWVVTEHSVLQYIKNGGKTQMKTRKVLAVLLALVLCLGVLAGCAQDPAETSKPVESTTPADATNPTETTAPTEP